MTTEHKNYDLDAVTLTDKQKKIQRRRNIAVGVILGVLSAIFFAATFIQLGKNVTDRML